MKLCSWIRKTKNWLNPYNDYNKVPQNLKNKLKDLHFSKAFLDELICWGGGHFRESLFHEYKNKLDESEKS